MLKYATSDLEEYKQLKHTVDYSKSLLIKGHTNGNLYLLINLVDNKPIVYLLGWSKNTFQQVKQWLITKHIKAQLRYNKLYVFGQLCMVYDEQISTTFGRGELIVNLDMLHKYGITTDEINNLLEGSINYLNNLKRGEV